MNLEQERLEKEMRFLEESLKTGIVTQEEYDRAKSRIEKEMKDLKPEEPKKTFNLDQLNAKIITPKPKEEEEIVSTDKPDTVESPPKKGRWVVTLIILVFAALIWWNIQSPAQSLPEPPTFVCTDNSNCASGQECRNGGTSQAQCMTQVRASGDIKVLSNPTCKLCDDTAMQQTLQSLFPGTTITAVMDSPRPWYPVYVIDKSLSSQKGFSSINAALVEEADGYVVSPTALDTLYIPNREMQPGVAVYLAPYGGSTAATLQALSTFNQPVSIHFVGQNNNGRLIPRAGGSTLESERQFSCISRLYPEESVDMLTCILGQGETVQACVNAEQLSKITNCSKSEESINYLTQDYQTTQEFAITTSPAYIINNQYRVSGYKNAFELEKVYCTVNDC